MTSNPTSSNQFLASLSPDDLELIRPHLRSIELRQETVLVRTGELLQHVYFPESGIVSLVTRLLGGEATEAAMIGRDSVFGASVALDGGIALNEAIVQIGGSASILNVPELRLAAEKSLTLRTSLIRHEQALLAQALQTSACNSSHKIEARFCRWLLRARDLCGDDLPLTQEFIAQMLGIQRTSVSFVAGAVQRAGLISYRHGHIRIIDHPGLENISCECAATVRSHYDRLRAKG